MVCLFIFQKNIEKHKKIWYNIYEFFEKEDETWL